MSTTNGKPGNKLLAPGYQNEEGPHHYHTEDGTLMIDFTGDQQASEILRGELAPQEMDPATGFPKHLVWTTKDGRRIPIPHLQDSHLLNIVGFLRKRVDSVYKKQVLKKILKRVIRSTALMMDPFDMGDGDGGVFDFSDHIKELEADAVTEGREVLTMRTDDFLRKYSLQFPFLLQEAYRRKLLIESHDNYSLTNEAKS